MARSAIVSELEQIRRKAGGTLKPADVVEYARNPKSCLHSRFCWDDTEAAHRYRLWQARSIIADVTIIPSKESDISVRAYVALKEDRGEDSYRATVDVLSDDDRRAAMLRDALAELQAFRRKYAALSEVAKLDVTIAELRSAMRTATVGRAA